jgi:hypothetical protein
MEMQRSKISSYAQLPPKPECDVLDLKLRDNELLAPDQFKDLLKALTAFYFPGKEPPEMKITDADRGPEHFTMLVLALAVNALRLEHDPPEVMEVVGRTEATLTFYVTRLGPSIDIRATAIG